MNGYFLLKTQMIFGVIVVFSHFLRTHTWGSLLLCEAWMLNSAKLRSITGCLWDSLQSEGNNPSETLNLQDVKLFSLALLTPKQPLFTVRLWTVFVVHIGEQLVIYLNHAIYHGKLGKLRHFIWLIYAGTLIDRYSRRAHNLSLLKRSAASTWCHSSLWSLTIRRRHATADLKAQTVEEYIL